MKNIKKPGGNHYPAIKGLMITRSFTCLPLGLPYPQTSPHTPAPPRSSFPSKHQLANQYTLQYFIHNIIIISIILEPGPSGESSFARPTWPFGCPFHPKAHPSIRRWLWRPWASRVPCLVPHGHPPGEDGRTFKGFFPKKHHGTKTQRKHWKFRTCLMVTDEWTTSVWGGIPIVEVYAMKIERDGVYRYRLQLDRTCYGWQCHWPRHAMYTSYNIHIYIYISAIKSLSIVRNMSDMPRHVHDLRGFFR